MASFLVHFCPIFSCYLHLLMDVDLILKVDTDFTDFTDFTLFYLCNPCLILEYAIALIALRDY